MSKTILGVIFVSLLLVYEPVWAGHIETIYAERIIGNLSKGVQVPDCDINELLGEAAKSERGSSQGSSESLNSSVETETNWLITKAEDIFNEQEMDNLGLFLEKIYKRGGSDPAALAEAICVVRQLF